MMSDAIKEFPKQFLYDPEIENAGAFRGGNIAVVVGMGGSHLAADLLKIRDPFISLIIHEDFGLPSLSDEKLQECLIILNSYSGNTEETIDAYEKAHEFRLSTLVISSGGRLLERAKENKTPFIRLPHLNIQPRMAIGLFLRALLHAVKRDDLMNETAALVESLKKLDQEYEARKLFERIKKRVPIIYASSRNRGVAYNWKIKFNETAKIPAFYNVVPELDHNEMTGFDSTPETVKLSENFYFLFLKDANDDVRVQKRMSVLNTMYRQRGLRGEMLEIDSSAGVFHGIFSSLLLADHAALKLAEFYGVDPENVPIVEEFKKMLL